MSLYESSDSTAVHLDLDIGFSNEQTHEIPKAATIHEGIELIAVIGMSLRFPQDAISPESFWNKLMESKSAQTKVPNERYNVDAFYRSGNLKTGMVRQ
jgi:hypothetical protein